MRKKSRSNDDGSSFSSFYSSMWQQWEQHASSESESNTGSEAAATSEVANKDKPLVWFNRQPSNSSTGELDKTALNFNKDTYYVGFDANQGAEVQGQMVKDYIEKNIDKS